jgi:RNA polymerase sigma-70 factor (ECF subfamily)
VLLIVQSGFMSSAASTPASRLIEACYGELLRFARRKLGGEHVADDLVQEACLRYANARTQSIVSPRAFLYRILANLVVDHQRRRGRQACEPLGEIEPVDGSADAESALIWRERLAILSRAVEELPPRCRECFVLRRFDELPQDEIARRMGISRNMVEKHLRAAALHCARRLREHD